MKFNQFSCLVVISFMVIFSFSDFFYQSTPFNHPYSFYNLNETVQNTSFGLMTESNFILKKKITQATNRNELNLETYSYVEDFDTTDYLNIEHTTASGWGSGKIQSMIKGIGPPVPIYNMESRMDRAYGVYIKDNYAYVAADNRDLMIVDISNPTDPSSWQEVQAWTTGGARDVFICDNYAYVTVQAGGLAIIDVNDPNNPGDPIYTVVNDSTLDVFIQGDFAYLAAYTSGLAIINISDPTNPGPPIYRNTTDVAQGVFVSGDYAYIASGDSGLAIINISDPTNPGPPIYRTTAGNARDIYVNGNHAYLADGENGLVIIDISDPMNPGVPIYRNVSDNAECVWISGSFAYVGTLYRFGSFYGGALVTIDISDPTTPGTPIYYDYGDHHFASRDLYVNGDYIYVAGGRAGLVVCEQASRNPTSRARSKSIYTGSMFVQNVTLSVNQTVHPNTSIQYYVSTGGPLIPIVLDESLILTENPYQGLYWCAILKVDNPQGPSPWIESLMIEFVVTEDEVPPVIKLTNIKNDSIISSGAIINCSIIDFTYSHGWYNWDEENNFTLTDPWVSVSLSLEEGYHWLTIFANDSAGHQSTSKYRFYVNCCPRIELKALQNNSVISTVTIIDITISDLTPITCWYHWDNKKNISLSSPFMVKAINSSGWHVLTVGAQDIWNSSNSQSFIFYILGLAAIEINQAPSTTIYSGKTFVYSFTITNHEIVPLNLRLIAIGHDDDILSGNDSYITVVPEANKTMELKIRPKHTSIHQLEIFLIHENLVYYNGILQFNVIPQWLSPSFLINSLFLIFGVGIALLFVVTLVVVIRKQQLG